MATIIINNLNKRIREMDNISTTLQGAGENVKNELISNWNKSLGGDGTSFKPLTTKYKNYKSKITGSTRPNMRLTGRMISTLKTRLKGKYTAIVGFSPGQQPKAEGNANIRPNMMAVSKEMISSVTNYILKKLKGL